MLDQDAREQVQRTSGLAALFEQLASAESWKLALGHGRRSGAEQLRLLAVPVGRLVSVLAVTPKTFGAVIAGRVSVRCQRRRPRTAIGDTQQPSAEGLPT